MLCSEIVRSSRFHLVHGVLYLFSTEWNVQKDFLKVAESRVDDCLIDSFSARLFSSCNLGRLWKCWVHVFRSWDGSESRTPFTQRRVHLDFPRFCGILNRRWELARKSVSHCTRLLSSIAEQYFIRCRTSLCKAHLALYKGPLDGLPSALHALHASLLFAHSCDSVLSLNL